MSIKAFVEKVLADKSSNLQKIELGKVTDAEIEFLKETVSLDLTDYCRVLEIRVSATPLKNTEILKLKHKEGK